jgi:hypothetical protein
VRSAASAPVLLAQDIWDVPPPIPSDNTLWVPFAPGAPEAADRVRADFRRTQFSETPITEALKIRFIMGRG